MPRTPRPIRIIAIPALLAALFLSGGCSRQIRTVELPTMTFASEVPPIAGSVEVCIPPKLSSRQWNVADHPYRVELGKRAAINFERLVKAAFVDARATYTEDCSADRDLPWIQAWIISANRDWDGIEGIFDPEPVDTALTMALSLHAVDGNQLWSTTVTAKHRVVDPAPPPFGVSIRSLRGSRDFGVVLRDALDQGYQELITAPEVRAAFDDVSLLEPIAPEAEPQAEAAPGEVAN